eukprot:1148568-Pelagomonas_calceolata.AAC.3
MRSAHVQMGPDGCAAPMLLCSYAMQRAGRPPDGTEMLSPFASYLPSAAKVLLQITSSIGAWISDPGLSSSGQCEECSLPGSALSNVMCRINYECPLEQLIAIICDSWISHAVSATSENLSILGSIHCLLYSLLHE